MTDIMTSHDEYLRRGDAYVGTTSAPNAIASWKKFDPSRYGTLSWPDLRGCPGRAPNSAADSEGGLVWDILSQAGAALKSPRRNNPLRDLRVEKVYATWYSQSGAYLTRYWPSWNSIPCLTTVSPSVGDESHSPHGSRETIFHPQETGCGRPDNTFWNHASKSVQAARSPCLALWPGVCRAPSSSSG
ncbi:alpha/beta hydrolase domain-containing protein [Nonomuraea sp. NPDC049400]|uniref:alpha/beta hydrolase domain-containing protein n=1 Tax=Nonomuraea sp. NPDC049400 TaxID=3364352 RepID=UPI0037B5CFA4